MINLSVNVNKIATLRNSRGGRSAECVARGRDLPAGGRARHHGASASGRAAHPRHGRHRHRALDRPRGAAASKVEFNIEGDPRPGFIDLVLSARPDQCTLVPVIAGEVTSQAGWPAETSPDRLAGVIRRLKAAGIRVSLFVDPQEAPVRWAARLGADRVEFYTEPFARAFAAGEAAGRQAFASYRAAAELAHALGLGVNAGHDLDLENLVLFRTLPHLAEVSIGHALISHALWVGLDRAVRDYLDVLKI